MATCPVCGEEAEVLRETPEHVTVKCGACGAVRTVAPPRLRWTDVRLVLSDGERSWTDSMQVPADEPVAVGDEFEHDGHRFLVTGVERQDGVKADKTVARELRTCFAKRFDEVVLKITLNEGETTRALELAVEPERRVRIGDVLEVQGRRVVVKALKSDLNRTVRSGFLFARSVVRVFCDPVGRRAFRKAGPRRPATARRKPGRPSGGARRSP